LADAAATSLRAWHATLAAADPSVAIGHGLDAPWAALPGDSLVAIDTLHGPAPAKLWLQATAAPAEIAA
jgi:hypothetical protein